MLRSLVISAGVLILFLVGLFVWNRETVGLMLANVQAMGEGTAEAEAMRVPADVLAYLAAHPENVSLVVHEAGAPEHDMAHRAEVRRPVVGLDRLWVLAAYAEHVAAGGIGPETMVPWTEVERVRLPGLGSQGAAEADAAGALTMADLATTMMRQNDLAAMDVLIDRLDRRVLETVPETWNLTATDPSLPNNGRYLSWHNHTLDASPEDRLAQVQALTPGQRRDTAFALSDRYRDDPGFRDAEAAARRTRGAGLSLSDQQAFARHTFPHTTAADLAAFLEHVVTDPMPRSATLRSFLERPLATDTTRTVFDRSATLSGGFPGLISFAGYVQPPGGKPVRIAVLLVERVPAAVFYHLMQTGLHHGFLLQLLADDDFVQTARDRLNRSRTKADAGDG